MAFFQERLGLEFTYFNKKSEDALIARRLPPSLGLTASVLDNLGSIRNSGTELGINLNVVDNDTWGWDLRFTNTTLDNKIEELGEGVEPIIFNRGSQRHQNGLPAGAFYMQPVSYDDADGNGLLSVDEVIVADTAEFLGRALPTRLNSFSTTLRLFDWFSASTLFEGRFGNHQLNDTEAFRCGFRSTYGCAAVSKQGASPTGIWEARVERCSRPTSSSGGSFPSRSPRRPAGLPARRGPRGSASPWPGGTWRPSRIIRVSILRRTRAGAPTTSVRASSTPSPRSGPSWFA